MESLVAENITRRIVTNKFKTNACSRTAAIQFCLNTAREKHGPTFIRLLVLQEKEEIQFLDLFLTF